MKWEVVSDDLRSPKRITVPNPEWDNAVAMLREGRTIRIDKEEGVKSVATIRSALKTRGIAKVRVSDRKDHFIVHLDDK
jgi:hypothetical protein